MPAPTASRTATIVNTCLAVFAAWITFSTWTTTSWLSFPQFVGAVLLLFVLPGSALCRLFRLVLRPIERLALATALGMAATCSLYVLLQWLGFGAAFWVWIIIGFFGIRELRCAFGGARTDHLRWEHAFLPLAVLAGCAPLAVINVYYSNLSLTGDGGMIVAYSNDLLLHASIGSELTHTIPPQVPFLAGVRLNYHVGMDVVTAVLARFGGLAIPDLMVRFCPTLFIVLDVLAAFCVIRRVTNSGAAGVVGALLATLGEDFSFVPGWLLNSEVVWSTALFRVPSVFSLYWHNPMGVAHGFLFLSFFCLQRAADTAQVRWAAPFAVLCAVLIEIKLFTFLHLAGALGIASLVLLLGRRTTFLMPGTLAAALSLPLVGYMAVVNVGTPTFAWSFRSALPYYVSHAWTTVNLPWLAQHTIPGTIAYLATTFGIRIIGVPAMLQSILKFTARPFEFFLVVFVVVGVVLTLGSYVLPAVDVPNAYNNSVWFMIESKHAASIFAALGLCAIWRRGGPIVRVAIVPVLAIIGFASTVQAVVKMATRRPVSILTRSDLAFIKAVAAETQPGDVVLSRNNPPLLLLAGRRVPLQMVFAPSFASAEDIRSRSEAVEGFWHAWDGGTLDTKVLTRYQVRWIAAETRGTPAAVAKGAVCNSDGSCVSRVHDGGSHVLYRVDLQSSH